MRAAVRLFLAAAVLAGAAYGISTMGSNPILADDVRAEVHGEMLHIEMKLQNSGDPDRLIGVASPEAETARLVSSDAEELPIPANSDITLSRDGAYIALSGVSGAPDEGRLIPLSLEFEAAGTVAVKARIERPMRMMHGGAGMVHAAGDGETPPSLAIAIAPDPQGGWTVTLNTQDFEFVQAEMGAPHEPGRGHAHLYVGGVKLGRLYQPTGHVPALPPGKHVVRVTLNTNDHRTYLAEGKPVSATLEVVAE